MNDGSVVDEGERRLAASARRLLDASVESLGPDALARLRSARRHAVDLRAKPPRFPWLIPAAVFVSAAALMIVLSLGTGVPAGDPSQGLADIDILSSADGLDLYEDLDFYEWLDANGQGQAG